MLRWRNYFFDIIYSKRNRSISISFGDTSLHSYEWSVFVRKTGFVK